MSNKVFTDYDRAATVAGVLTNAIAFLAVEEKHAFSFSSKKAYANLKKQAYECFEAYARVEDQDFHQNHNGEVSTTTGEDMYNTLFTYSMQLIDYCKEMHSHSNFYELCAALSVETKKRTQFLNPKFRERFEKFYALLFTSSIDLNRFEKGRVLDLSNTVEDFLKR